MASLEQTALMFPLALAVGGGVLLLNLVAKAQERLPR